MPMLSLILPIAALVQSAPPMMPPGASPEFQKLSVHIRKLSQSDPAAARAALTLLPTKQLAIEWDDSAIGANLRKEYAIIRDAAIESWRSRLLFEPSLVSRGANIRFTFGSEEKAVFGLDPAGPRLVVTLPAAGPLNPARLQNQVAHWVGAYYGLANLPFPSGVMTKEPFSGRALTPLQPEVGMALTMLNYSRQLDALVQAGKPISADLPKLDLAIREVKGGPVLQGEGVDFHLAVKNSGTAPLQFRIIPDCSCFSTNGILQIDAGVSRDAHVRMDTTEFSGIVSKKLWLITNDPEEPVRTLPVEVDIKERYRLHPSTAQVLTTGDRETIYETWVTYEPGSAFQIRSATTEGLESTVRMEKWKGVPPEGGTAREGYKFTLKAAPLPDTGRFALNILLETDIPNMRQVRIPIYIQRGIIAMPEQLFLGDVGAAPREASFLISKPGKDYKVTRVTTDSRHLAARAEPVGLGDYKIIVTYDGKAPTGDYRSSIIIETDDQAQPKIFVPVIGMVK